MGLIQRLAQAAQAFRGAPQGVPMLVQKGGNWQVLWAKAREAELLAGSLNAPFAQHPTVYAAVSAIFTNLGAVPLESFPKSDTKREKPITDSPVVDRLFEPNEYMLGNQLIESTLASLELYGNALWFPDAAARPKGRDSGTFPTKIEFWEWENVHLHRKQTTGPIELYEYRGVPAMKALPQNVIHFKYPNPYDKYVGMGALEAAMLEARTDYRAGRWNEAYFKNAAVPTGFLSPKEGQIVKEESLERMRDTFENRHMGENKHGKIGVLTAAFEWLNLGTDPKDMDFVNLRYMGQEKILMVFKVPPVVAGVLRDANYNLAIQQTKQFWHNHSPKLLYVVGVINRRLIQPAGLDEALWPKWEVVKALSEDIVAQATTMREYFNVGVPFEEINRRFDLGFDAKKHKAHSTSWLPFSLVNADLQAEVDPNEETGTPPGNQNQPGQDTGADPQKGLRLLRRAASPDAIEIARTVVWKSLITRVRDEEQAFEKRTRDHMHSLKREVLRNLDAELAKHGKAVVGGMRLVKDDDNPAVFEVDAVLFDAEKAAQDMKRKAAPLYKSAAQKAATSVQTELSINFDLLTQGMLDYVDRKIFQIAGLVDDHVADALRAALRAGLTEGEAPEGIRDRIEEVFDVERSRARTIARTEVNSVFSNGRAAAFEAAGVEQIQWITARDTRVRGTDPNDHADHVSLDGEVATLGSTFSNGLRWALDEQGPVQEVANCRCVNVAA